MYVCNVQTSICRCALKVTSTSLVLYSRPLLLLVGLLCLARKERGEWEGREQKGGEGLSYSRHFGPHKTSGRLCLSTGLIPAKQKHVSSMLKNDIIW